MAMIRLFVRHQVADYEKWRKVYDGFDAERTTMGVRGQKVFRSAEDGNDVTIWHDFADLETAKEFAASSKLREKMNASGVVGEPQSWFTREA
jgi:hypothetical protein